MAGPSKGTPISDEERKAIADAVRSGKSRYAVAKEFRRSRDAVARIAREAGLDADTTSVEAANRARSEYSQAERVRLLNDLFAKAEEVLATTVEPRDLRDLVISVATLIDKRRLEDGDVTERTETVTIIDDIPRE